MRIIRTCRELGIPSVAVYSDADRDALHVQMADQAFRIGPALASDSYLSIGAIARGGAAVEGDPRAPRVRVPGRAGAVRGRRRRRRAHVRRTQRAGHRDDGRQGRRAARRRRRAACRSCPGRPSPWTCARARRQAERIGFPLLVKAAFGGGGKGMHVVRDADHLEESLQAGGARGAVLLRPARGLPRALRRPRAPRGGAGHRRHARQRACSWASATARCSGGTRS